MAGYTLIYDDWSTSGDYWFDNRIDALAWFDLLAEKQLAGRPAYASITLYRDSDRKVIREVDNL